MMLSDPIADMLTRIRNAIAVRKSEVSLPHSKAKEAVARILQQSNFIESVNVEKTDGAGKKLVVRISADRTNAKITEIVKLSTPGRRMYTKATKIPAVKRGRGIVIVSTSKGVMTGDQAKRQKLGGELICKVY